MEQQQHDTDAGGRTWWGGTPSPLMREEVDEIARKEGRSVRSTMYNLVREALAARRKAAPGDSDSRVMHVSVTLDRATFDLISAKAEEKRCSVDAFLRKLIRSGARQSVASQPQLQERTANTT